MFDNYINRSNVLASQDQDGLIAKQAYEAFSPLELDFPYDSAEIAQKADAALAAGQAMLSFSEIGIATETLETAQAIFTEELITNPRRDEWQKMIDAILVLRVSDEAVVLGGIAEAIDNRNRVLLVEPDFEKLLYIRALREKLQNRS